MKIQVVILHANHIIVTGLYHILTNSPLIETVKTVQNEDELWATIKTNKPDIILLPYNLLDDSTIPLVQTLANSTPPIPTIVYTRLEEDNAIKNMLAAGTTGYALHTDTPEMLLEAIQTVAKSQTWLSPTIIPKVSARIRHELSQIETLTDKDKQLLQMVAQGLSNREISDQMGYAHQTIKNCISALYTKLNVQSRTQLLLRAQELGLSPDQNQSKNPKQN